MLSVKIENISKQYKLGKIGTGTLSHDINRLWSIVRGKGDPNLELGVVNDRTSSGTTDYVWALKDVSFEIEEGDVVGIVGKNGAGKSTLLKILSNITTPTLGNIKIRGNMASLLEVGTGFHPEMTGRENIYMNGTIMGMPMNHIKSKLDEIVEFAGVSKYLDTPVKRYSSGMIVRLGFSVAAHLEPDILVVDEVLAVGDVEFQKKAIGKMQEVSSNKGRTVLFVSHNMNSLRKLCNKGVLFHQGQNIFEGVIDDVINKYIAVNADMELNSIYKPDSIKSMETPVYIKEANILRGSNNENSDFIEAGEDIIIQIMFGFNKTLDKDVYGGVVIYNNFGESVIQSDTNDVNFDISALSEDKSKVILTIPKRVLKVGEYTVFIHIGKWRDKTYKSGVSNTYLKFNIVDSSSKRMENRNALVSTLIDWKLS